MRFYHPVRLSSIPERVRQKGEGKEPCPRSAKTIESSEVESRCLNAHRTRSCRCSALLMPIFISEQSSKTREQGELLSFVSARPKASL